MPTQIKCGTSAVNDKVFLLSKEELTSPKYGFQEHCGWDSARAKKNSGVMSMYDTNHLSWWTRSVESSTVVGVHSDGDMSAIREVNPPTSGFFAYYMGVVPAIRILLKESECKNALNKPVAPVVSSTVGSVKPVVKQPTATSTTVKKPTVAPTPPPKPTSTYTAPSSKSTGSSSKKSAPSAPTRHSVNSFATLQKQLQKQKEYKASGRCQHCGGTFKGLFTKTCSSCGKKKDY